jgi:hypothetical protein
MDHDVTNPLFYRKSAEGLCKCRRLFIMFSHAREQLFCSAYCKKAVLYAKSPKKIFCRDKNDQ